MTGCAPLGKEGRDAHRLRWTLRGPPREFAMIDLDSVLFVGAVVLIMAIVAARIGSRVGLPSLLVFLALGMALGDSGPLGWRFDNADLAQALGFGALVLILAEGGLTTRWRDIRPSIGPAVMLATVGVGVSIGLMTVFGYFVLGLDLWVAVLLGAVTAPTDAAAVFSVLRRVPIPHRLRGMLEAESGLNDAPTVLIVGVASTAAITGASEGGGGLALVGLIVLELVAGLLIGIALGWLGVQILRRVALPSSGLYPLATLGLGGLRLRRRRVGPHQRLRRRLRLRGDPRQREPAAPGCDALLRRGCRLDRPDRAVRHARACCPPRAGSTWNVVLVAVVAGLFLTFVARPLSVLASVAPFRIPVRAAAVPVLGRAAGSGADRARHRPAVGRRARRHFLFDVVLVFVVVFTCLQGPTLPFVGRRLGLINDETASEVEVEVAPLDKISADLLQVRIPPGSRLSGIEIAELRLPKDTVVSLIIRDATPFTPSARDRIKVGDELLVVTPTAQRDITEERLRSSRPRRPAGPLARSEQRGLSPRLRRPTCDGRVISHRARVTASVRRAGRRSAS